MKLWKITGIGYSGKPVIVTVRAKDHGAALERFTSRHRNVRVVSVVLQD